MLGRDPGPVRAPPTTSTTPPPTPPPPPATVPAPADSAAPSGLQFPLGHGAQRAVVTEVGATLRSYTVDGADVLEGFGIDAMCDAGRGQVLAPWPNRLGDGAYAFEGRSAQAALDEPARHN
ncbi:MAG TPA: hypothetical protein VMB72_05000, partial [Acidimicrobiales bacterium]|nr:hypothetical protein [Acidimicrobiales bacterium]